MVRYLALLILVMGQSALCASGKRPIVAFLSDYGNSSPSVSICKGIMLSVDSSLSIVDITHAIPPFSRDGAASVLAETAPYFPAGTVFVVVVDPEFEGKSQPIAVKSSSGHYFIIPDNGIITLIAHNGIGETRDIDEKYWSKKEGVPISFGRDIYCPVAARLAAGMPFEKLGRLRKEPRKIVEYEVKESEAGITGLVQSVDRIFGNVVTNIGKEYLTRFHFSKHEKVKVSFTQGTTMEFTWVDTFSDVPVGDPVMYLTPDGKITFGKNKRNFAAEQAIKPLHGVTLYRKVSTATDTAK